MAKRQRSIKLNRWAYPDLLNQWQSQGNPQAKYVQFQLQNCVWQLNCKTNCFDLEIYQLFNWYKNQKKIVLLSFNFLHKHMAFISWSKMWKLNSSLHKLRTYQNLCSVNTRKLEYLSFSIKNQSWIGLSKPLKLLWHYSVALLVVSQATTFFSKTH